MDEFGSSNPVRAWDRPTSAPTPVARLVYEAFAHFYDLFSSNSETLITALSAQIGEEGTEVENTRVLPSAEEVVGAYCCYPFEEMESRQFISLRMLLEAEDVRADVFDRLKEFQGGISVLKCESLYLSRIAIAAGSRGRGYGQVLLRDFENEAKRRGRNHVSLHVRRDNHRAIRFYEAAGYEIDRQPEAVYRWMIKKVA